MARQPLIRVMMMAYLSESEAVTGYDFIRFCREHGVSASPGNVYPLLRALEAEGVMVSHVEGKRKVYELTERGQSLVQAAPFRRIPQAVRQLGIRQMALAVQTDWENPGDVERMADNARRAVRLLEAHLDLLRRQAPRPEGGGSGQAG